VRPEPPKQPILPPLTGIRGLTILWVVFYHLHSILDALLPGLSGFVAVTMGVRFRMDLLFMLSGFLISYVYIANRGKLTLGAYEDFLRLRVIRLYPVYIATTVLFFFLREITSPASSEGLRLCLLLILVGLILAYVLLLRRVEAALRVCSDFISSRRIGVWPIVLTTSLLLASGVVMIVHLSGTWGVHRAWRALPIRLAMAQAWPWVWRDDRSIPTLPQDVTHAVWSPVAQDGWHMSSVWFLSALWFAYLTVYPATWLLLRRLGKSWPTFVWVFAPVAVWLTVSEVPALNEVRAVSRACCGFVCGSALFVLYANGSRFIKAAQKHLDKTILVFFVLGVLIPALPSGAARRDVNFLLVLGAPFLLAGTTAELSYMARFLSTWPMMWLGKISYALFLSHETSIMVWNLVLPFSHYANSSALVRMLVMVGCLAFVLAVAVAIYRWVETPCAVALRSFARRRTRGVATDVSTRILAAPGLPQ
jgi:peptidoglycan/LPS O-acetylase OafA/YrhL